MTTTTREPVYESACSICGEPPLVNSGLCPSCHFKLVGESSFGVAFRRVPPNPVTVRAPGEKEAAS